MPGALVAPSYPASPVLGEVPDPTFYESWLPHADKLAWQHSRGRNRPKIKGVGEQLGCDEGAQGWAAFEGGVGVLLGPGAPAQRPPPAGRCTWPRVWPPRTWRSALSQVVTWGRL